MSRLRDQIIPAVLECECANCLRHTTNGRGALSETVATVSLTVPRLSLLSPQPSFARSGEADARGRVGGVADWID